MADKKPDWNKVRAEYITGNISQRKLARKYGISENTLIKRANNEKWAEQRNDTYNKCTAVVQQKTANAVASNAAKLEQAKSLALDWLIAVLQSLPPGKTGSRIRQAWTDNKGKYNTIDLSMSDVIKAIATLESGEPEAESEALKRAREILGGVKSAID